MHRTDRYLLGVFSGWQFKAGWQRVQKLINSNITSGERVPRGGRLKRIMDLIIASVTLVLAAPIMLVTAILIYFTMGRPIIFSHSRVGFNGSAFHCYKFRTMVNDAQDRLNEHFAVNQAAKQMWLEKQKLKEDPRVTPLGQLLRRSSIDELPQLINILRGEMSCVGPRPVTDSELQERFGIYSRYYKLACPGLTGLWQVSGRSNLCYRARIVLDNYYVRNWSLLLDFQILLKTLPAVLKFRNTS